VSLQRRLIAVMAVLMVIGLAVTGIVTYMSVRSFLYGRADDTLATSEGLAFDYLTYPGPRKAPVSAVELARHVSPDVYVVITDRYGKVVVQRPSGSPTRPDPEPLLSPVIPVQLVPEIEHDHFGRYAGTFRPDPDAVIVGGKKDPGAQYRVVAVTVPQGILYTAISLAPTNKTLESLRRIEVLASVAVLVVLSGAVFVVVRRGLRPLRSMTETADAIASGDLARRVPEQRESTEVGRLGLALNKMLTQIEGAFTEKSASEEQLRQFVADASHELRTPLTSIRGYAELLRRGAISDETGTAKALQRIEDEATRMGGLVEDLLLLAELDQGRPLRAEPVDLQQICSDVVGDCHAMAFDAGHVLAQEPGARVMVRGDAERLAQVAHNLVRNSLAHTPSGCTVTVVTGIDHDMGFIRVSDNGPGIEAAHLHRVFDRFFQGDPSRAGSGTGLGLAIVRAIAEALGGTASAGRAPEGGACMTVRIPLALADQGKGNGHANGNAAGTGSGSGTAKETVSGTANGTANGKGSGVSGNEGEAAPSLRGPGSPTPSPA
jgi:two-component system OmpR family sensor kinase